MNLKRLGIIFAVLLVVTAGTVAALIFGKGARIASLRTFIGQQVVGVVNTYLEPTLSFEELDFEAPYTVRMTGVALTGVDGTGVLDLGTLNITLAEMPSTSKPIKIKSIEIADGSVNIAVDPETGSIRGLTPLMKASGEDADRQSTGDKSTETDGEGLRLSDVLVLEQVSIRGVSLSLDTGQGPMLIEGFSADLAVGEAAEREGAPTGDGWYELAFTSGREPGLELGVDGRVNIDTFEVWLALATAKLSLNESTITSLPPAIAGLIEQYNARGEATAKISGTLPLTDPLAAKAELLVELADVRLTQGELQLPIERLTIDAAILEGVATLRQLEIDLFGGLINAAGDAHVSSDLIEAKAEWAIREVDLEKLKAHPESENAPDVAGILTGDGHLTASLKSPLDSIAGIGGLNIREGRLVNLPGLTQLTELAKATGLGNGKNHSLDVEFELKPDGIMVTDSEVITPALAAKATGLIGWNMSLDMIARAGPLKRLEAGLGQVGKALANLTDRLISYKVTGTVEEPEVAVQPLGIGG